MKNNLFQYVLFLVQLVVIINCSNAQSKQGVYLTKHDFIQNKITPELGVNKLHTTSKFIALKVNNIKYKYNKDSVFGYTDKNNIYRCNHEDKKDYCLVENGEIAIYILYETEYENKNAIREPHYYFSKNLDSKIVPLTIFNIKKMFPDNEKLQRQLDIEFYQKEISFYNKTLNTYQINFLIKQYK